MRLEKHWSLLFRNSVRENGAWNSLAVQWLGLGTSSSVTQVQSLGGELRTPTPAIWGKKKKNVEKKKEWFKEIV